MVRVLRPLRRSSRQRLVVFRCRAAPLVLSWMPHHPVKLRGSSRYGNTRAFKSSVGTLLTSGMEYHIVHHLYPNIPIHRTPQAYWALRPVLVARGCELGEL